MKLQIPYVVHILVENHLTSTGAETGIFFRAGEVSWNKDGTLRNILSTAHKILDTIWAFHFQKGQGTPSFLCPTICTSAIKD